MAIRYVAGASPLFLGRQGENLAREIEFDISDWVETFGEGTVQALHRRDKDAGPYPLNPTFNGGKVVWLVTDADTAYAGSGECELRYTVNDVLVKSKVYKTLVAPSLEGETANPEALPDWVANVLAVGDTIKSAEVLNHIHYVESMDKDNPLCIRDLDSGTYILHGYFKPVAAVTQKFTFSTDMLVSVVRFTSTSYAQVFYAKDNAIQYLAITDEGFTRKDAKLVNMESVANKVTVLDENSDHEHYPSAKAVVELLKGSGSGGTGNDGVGISSIVYKGTDENGGNIYTIILTDESTYDIVAPKGSDGENGVDGKDGADGKSAYQYAKEGGYTGTEVEFAAKLAEEMPTVLPNPNALTFAGAVDAVYDGSAPVSVEIPSGGGSTVNNNTINQYFYNSMATGKYDLKSGYGTTADIYIAADGTETAISGLYYVATDYIPVCANTTYVAYCNGYALYDREKTFVSAVIDRSNYGTIKEFTPEQDGYVRITYRGSVFSRLCEKSEIKKAPRDYMPAPSPFFDIRIPCNVDLYGDSNSYGYGLSDTANAWANRLGALLLSMPEEITNGARYEMSVFAGEYFGKPRLGDSGVVYMSAYTDKFTVNGEYITAVDIYIDGVQQEQMTASPAEYTCALGYHEIELRGSSGPNNVIQSIATNKTRSFTNHAVTGSNSGNLPNTVDGNVEIVMYGTNDRQIEYGNTAYNMARFYSACEAAGAKVYFLSPIPTTVEGETDASYVQTISDVISQIPDINYIDVYKDMQLYSLLSTETLYSDKLHLNDFGHKVLFCIVASKLHLAALNSIFGE